MKGLVLDILGSIRRMPLWVSLWIFLVLLPVNFVTLLFLDEPLGVAVACLAIGGILPNVFLLLRDRAFSSTMGVPHALVWPLLLGLVGYLLVTEGADLSGSYVALLVALLVIDGLSLIADARDTRNWAMGEVSFY